MIFKAFSVFDMKSGAFGVPFFIPTVGQAVRMFSDLASDGNSMVCRHPSDFVLYEIGTYDDATGLLLQLPQHVSHGLAIQHRRMPEDRLPLLDMVKVTPTNGHGFPGDHPSHE